MHLKAIWSIWSGKTAEGFEITILWRKSINDKRLCPYTIDLQCLYKAYNFALRNARNVVQYHKEQKSRGFLRSCHDQSRTYIWAFCILSSSFTIEYIVSLHLQKKSGNIYNFDQKILPSLKKHSHWRTEVIILEAKILSFLQNSCI